MDNELIENFGPIFRELREAKNMSLSSVSGEHFSISQLSKFELGVSDIASWKLFSALEAINVTSEEFMVAVRGYKIEPIEELIMKVFQYYTEKDARKLLNLITNGKENIEAGYRKQFYELTNAMIEVLLHDLDENFEDVLPAKKKLSEYLLRTEQWGRFELVLFGNVVGALESQFLWILGQELIARTEYYKNLPKHKTMINRILLNIILVCLTQKEFDKAEFFLKQAESFLDDETELYERCVFLYYEGYYLFSVNEKEQGMEKMKKAVSVFETLGSINLAENFRNNTEELIKG